MIFDSHAHLICADQTAYPPKPLRGELQPGEFDDPMTAEKLLGLMDQAGVARACAVQRAHVYGYDNSYIMDMAARYPDRFLAVTVLNAVDPATPDTLRQLARERNIRGVRFSSASFPSGPLDWLNSDAAYNSWKAATDLGLPVCIHVLYVQRAEVLPALKAMSDRIPEARVVVDHVGGAHAAHVELRWMKSEGIAEEVDIHPDALRLAENDNVTMKFSTINLERLEANDRSLTAFIDQTISTFGADRLIWGSDVGQSRDNYQHMVDLARKATAHLAPEVRQALLHDNTAKLYG
ncbi:MAG: amidohydrolase family protein [Spongiibacteraceae bacterium]|nr:amidohydrolase family protein [Spongiibacteraceae bacterium]